jgi:quercetin dioxygenase-like cupin family protein
MKTAKLILFGITVFVAGVLTGQLEITSVTAQETYPTESKGVGITKLGIVSKNSMTKQTGLEGYVLQLRLATMEPGGQIARHDHAKRPGLVYTLEGSWTEGRPEGEREYPAGEEIALVEDADTEHWFYNRTDKPVTFLICDLDNR